MAVKAVEKLIRVLDEMVVRYEELARTTNLQTHALMNHDLKLLKEIVEKQQIISKDLERLERARMEAIKVLASHFSVSVIELNLSGLAKFLPPRIFARIQPLAKRLKAECSELQKANQTNRELLEWSLNFVRFSIDTILGSRFEEPGYNQRGQVQEVEVSIGRRGRRLLDFKA